ncbi:hypothetical protein [Sphingomonas sp.]|uniref:hypothetical protein n=1 Tax=Sphingomonas sp. TaxID=28214 RepID=UPI001D1DB5C7|nr:hypothetical protein [Sphingomonas sp.]MBX9795573.1 hypothetical protein [Sphingomonas sp.]
MSDSLRFRVITAAVVAALTVFCVWFATQLLNLSSSAPAYNVLAAIFLAASIWTFVVNQMKLKLPREYARDALKSRTLILTLGLFLSLAMIWAIGRSAVEWAIEPDISDLGPCGRFTLDLCGTTDLNSERRDLAMKLVDRIAAASFLTAPISLAVPRVRSWFQ